VAEDITLDIVVEESNSASSSRGGPREKYKHFGEDFCCVPLCSNQRQKGRYNGVVRSYYQLLKDERGRACWLRLIRRGDDWLPKPWTRICSDHFAGGQIILQKSLLCLFA
jgi:THAP domain